MMKQEKGFEETHCGRISRKTQGNHGFQEDDAIGKSLEETSCDARLGKNQRFQDNDETGKKALKKHVLIEGSEKWRKIIVSKNMMKQEKSFEDTSCHRI